MTPTTPRRRRTARAAAAAPHRRALTERLEPRTLLSVELVANFWPGREFDPQGLVGFGDKVVFAGFEQTGRHAYATDGTTAGTVKLHPASAEWMYGQATAGERFWYQGYLGGPGAYSTDGTPAGTRRLGGATPLEYRPPDVPWSAELNERLLFVGYTTDRFKPELFSTDGTAAGTFALTAGLPAPHLQAVAVLGSHNGLAWFVDSADQGLHRLGVTDGTAAGTRILASLNTGAQSPFPIHFTAAGSLAYFQVPTAQGLKLWKSDGTAAGTGPVNTPRVVIEGTMAELGGKLYFFGATSDRSPAQLYRTDGAAVELVYNSALGGTYGGRSTLTRAGDYLWWQNGEDWRRDDGLGGLWRTDGTAAGTAQVARQMIADHFTHYGDRLYVSGVSALVDLDDPTQVRMTGLPAGTYPGGITFGAFSLVEMDGYAYFPYQHALYRAPVPTQYLANVDVRVFNDADGDGTQDPGEGSYGGTPPGSITPNHAFADLNGNGVHDGSAPDLEPYATLNADGTARLHGLRPGQYTIRIGATGVRHTTPHPVTVTVDGGQNPPPAVFGVNRNNRVTATVYDDANGNGMRDAAEPTLTGRRVYLDSDNDGTWDATEPSQFSDADGRVFWETLGNGRLRAEAPASWRTTQGAQGFEHSNNTQARDVSYTFGQTSLPAPGSVVAHTIYSDYDGDNVRSIVEPIHGTTVRAFLDADNDGVLDAGEASATSSSGRIDFNLVPPGNYRLVLLAPPGWTASAPPTTVVVNPGEATAAGALGLRPSAESGAVAGTVFADDDFDAVRDHGEPGVAGVMVYIDLTNNGRTTDDPVTMTDFLGGYRFPGLAAGTYRVRSVIGGDRAPLPVTADSRTVTYDGATTAVADLGVVIAKRTARFTGRVYHDVNANGVFDAADAPLPNVRVKATWPGLVALTDADGRYVLPHDNPPYTIRVDIPQDWVALSPAEATVQPVFRETVAGPDFRLTPAPAGASTPAAVEGHIFHDVDADGVRDPFEPAPVQFNGFDGQPYLDLDRDGFKDASEPAAYPDERGYFAFGGLAPGTYDVRLDVKNGHAQTTPAGPYRFTVAAGERATTPDFGWVHRPASASGIVYLDANGNGLREEGEGPAAGVRVAMDANGNGVFTDSVDRSTTTGATGQFTFSGLSPGNYALSVTGSPHHVQTDPAGGAAVSVPVAAGAQVTGLVLGAQRVNGTLTGTLYLDDDRDGQRDANEQLFQGWTVRVESVAEPVRTWTATTNASGQWRVEGVPAGSFRVTLVMASENFEVITPAEPSRAYLINLPAGEDRAGLDFGIDVKPARFYGSVVNETNGTRTPKPGVSVFLDANDNRTLDEGEPTATSDAAGRFDFGFLPFDISRWVFRALRPPRSLPVSPAEGNYDYIGVVSATPGQSHDVGSFVFTTPTTNFISGFVYRDLNANGRRDAGEPPLPGRTLHLDHARDGRLEPGDQYATSDAEGWYALPAGDRADFYPVRLVLLPGEAGTEPLHGGWQMVRFAPGGSATDVNFGSLPWPAPGASAVFHRGVVEGPTPAGHAAAPAPADAPTKRALLPGERAAFENVTTSSRGITGVTVDLAGLAPDTVLTADDFRFELMAGPAAQWSPATATPGVSLQRGAGLGGSDRVSISFPAGAAVNAWLRVTVLANTRTRLAQSDIFYFGNLPGDTGGRGTPTVDAADLARTRGNVGKTSPSALATYDFNRDGAINATDVLLARRNQRRSLPPLTAPAAPSSPLFATSPIHVPPARELRRPGTRGLLTEL